MNSIYWLSVVQEEQLGYSATPVVLITKFTNISSASLVKCL